MSELLLSGRNSTTNKKTVLNTDNEGQLKIDESRKINDILINISNLYNYTINNDLRYLRSQGKCFNTSYSYVGTAESRTMISLWNGTNDKKMYIYRITCQFDNDGNNDYATRVILYSTNTEPTNGSLTTARNLQIGSNNTSSATIRQNFDYVGANVTTFAHLLTADEPGLNLYNTFDYNEYIEVLPGNGFFSQLYCNNSTNKLRVNCNFYYIETSDTIPS